MLRGRRSIGGETVRRSPGVGVLGAVLEQQIDVFSASRGRLTAILPGNSGLIFDALIGYGLTDEPTGPIADLIDSVNGADAHVISLDGPSGLDPDSGHAPGAVVAPSKTVSLALPKSGLQAAIAGDIWLGDLGIHLPEFSSMGRSCT